MTHTANPLDSASIGDPEQLLNHLEQLEAQLAAVQAGLAHSHRLAMLGTLATIIAHEFNNILTPIISYSQIALAEPDDRELLVKTVEKSLSGAERAARISAAILGFGGQDDEDQPEAADLSAVVDEALACLAREPRKDGIELTLDVPNVRLQISPLSLQQVLLNLILNARKAMGRGPGHLRVTAEISRDIGPDTNPDGQNANMVRITVADSGPGIAPEIRDHLFEPFVTAAVGDRRAGDAASGPPSEKGTGLGLSICRQLIEKAGGRIWVESEPGQGAAFHFALPLACEQEALDRSSSNLAA